MAAELGPLMDLLGRSFEAIARTTRSTQLGFLGLAMAVGVLSGLGAVLFRGMILGVTWLATGYTEFGQQGQGSELATFRASVSGSY